MLEHPFERFIRVLEARGYRVKRRGADQVRATCPAHSDARPSLVLTRRDDRVLVHCHAGCRTSALVAALGLTMTDLFVAPGTSSVRAEIVATYDYRNSTSVLLAQKVRLQPKGFRWRRPDPEKPGKWLWGLSGLVLGLYRLDQLTGVRRVFLAEVEKAVNSLLKLGLHATCPPSGASRWLPEWSRDLWNSGCRELVILPDRDPSGERHALRVAEATHAIQVPEPIRIKIVQLPGLEPGQDAFDWLEEHTPTVLVQMAFEAPWWTPGAAERARQDRRRRLTRERVRRYRLRQREQLRLRSETSAA